MPAERIVDEPIGFVEADRSEAIDGTPVLDIKPVLREFLACDPVSQPDWSTELMRADWNHED